MPPKKDGDASKDNKKKPRKSIKPRKKKDECPSRIRKTNRVVLNKQARDIIAKVYDFMKREALADYAEKLTNVRWRTATAVGVSEKTVSRILKDRNKKYIDGSVAAGTAALVHEKAEAVKSYGHALEELVTGNITGAGESFVTGVADCVHADAAGLSAAVSGGADAVGQLVGSKIHADSTLLAAGATAAGQIAGGKLAAVADMGAGFDALTTANLTAAGSSFAHAAAAIAAGDADAIGTIFSAL